ncbi:MAG: hypothetical protein AAF799_47135 [Myxococcota bacterium]
MIETRPTLAYGFVADLYVIVHRTKRASDEDWQGMRRHMHAQETVSRLLVMTRGASLHSIQRRQARELCERHGMRVGVLGDARLARGMPAVPDWFGSDAKGFRAHDMTGALTYLERSQMYTRLVRMLAPKPSGPRLEALAPCG